MNWSQAHGNSEVLATLAHQARREGQMDAAKDFFRQAAEQERVAFGTLGEDRPRTLGITAVSATALFYKGAELAKAEQLAHQAMAMPGLPTFAHEQLRSLLQAIWNERAQEEAGVAFASGQVVVSVKGGQVVTGGAPLDLILSKVQVVQSLFYRTAEFLKDAPLRMKGPPPKEIQDKYRPWLFQSVPGSYQFIVAVQKPKQQELFPTSDPEPELLTETFLSILRASADDAPESLQVVVPQVDYRKTFLKLTRNLAPTGKAFERLEIRGTADSEGVVLSSHSRKQIADQLKPLTPIATVGEVEEVVQGTLRALDLEHDWLEVTTEPDGLVRVSSVGEVVDDVIGPMVNHRVSVRVRRDQKGRLSFLDIETDE